MLSERSSQGLDQHQSGQRVDSDSRMRLSEWQAAYDSSILVRTISELSGERDGRLEEKVLRPSRLMLNALSGADGVVGRSDNGSGIRSGNETDVQT